jgi:hypothetical protein
MKLSEINEPQLDLTVSSNQGETPAASATTPSGKPIMPGQRFCPSCSKPVVQTAAVCPHCGTALGAPKSKGIAILLAVFLSFWTWVYTYHMNKTKFWVGLGLSLVGGILTIFIVGIFVVAGVWLWAIIDAVATPDQKYLTYFGS